MDITKIIKDTKRCQICYAKKLPHLKVFLARFPLDPIRCREWVKAVGLEDLALLPIEKLHENKFVCGSHFIQTVLIKKGNRLLNSFRISGFSI